MVLDEDHSLQGGSRGPAQYTHLSVCILHTFCILHLVPYMSAPPSCSQQFRHNGLLWFIGNMNLLPQPFLSWFPLFGMISFYSSPVAFY